MKEVQHGEETDCDQLPSEGAPGARLRRQSQVRANDGPGHDSVVRFNLASSSSARSSPILTAMRSRPSTAGVRRSLDLDIACQQADFTALIHAEGTSSEMHVLERLVQRDNVLSG